jgi:hypothetical protein
VQITPAAGQKDVARGYMGFPSRELARKLVKLAQDLDIRQVPSAG